MTPTLGIFIISSNIIFLSTFFISKDLLNLLSNYFSLPFILYELLFNFSHKPIPIIDVAFIVSTPLTNIFLGAGIIYKKNIARILFIILQLINCVIAMLVGYVWLGFIKFWNHPLLFKTISMFLLLFISIMILPITYIIIFSVPKIKNEFQCKEK